MATLAGTTVQKVDQPYITTTLTRAAEKPSGNNDIIGKGAVPNSLLGDTLNSKTPKKVFAVSIKTAHQYEVGDSVDCEITITNITDEDYHLLSRETPLEGLRSDIFTVYKSRKLIPYDGIMVKRGAPTVRDFTLIKAKSEWKGTVDISTAYCFTSAGTYTMHLSIDAIFRKESLPESTQTVISNTTTFQLTGSERSLAKRLPDRKKEPHAPRASSEVPIPPILAGDFRNAEDERKTKDAYNRAYTAIGGSITSAQSDRDLYEEWFGNRISTCFRRNNTRIVSCNYEKMRRKMETEEITLHSEPGTPAYYAYVNPRDLSTIHLCGRFFTDPESGTDTVISGTDSMMGTIVHEVSHLAAGTIDEKDRNGKNGCKNEVYGQARCRILAAENSIKARNNGDNYEYFAEAQ
jgi:peptidyl-Lys metalloendopeptidase